MIEFLVAYVLWITDAPWYWWAMYIGVFLLSFLGGIAKGIIEGLQK